MSTEVIQPAPGQTVITTDHRHHDRHHDGDHFRETRLDADYRALTAQVERFGTINGDRTMSGVQVTGDRVTAVGSATALASGRTNELVQAAACRTDSLVQAGFGDTSGQICASTKDVTAALGTGFTADALAACKLSDQVAEAKLQTAIGFKDSIIANNVGFSAATVQAATIGSAAQVLATAFANQAQNTATVNFNAQTVQTERVRAELALAQTTGFAAAQLYAAQNKADSDAKLAECCCKAELQAAENFAKLSALVTADGNVTRALINTNTIEQLRAQLVATQRLIPVTIPVGAG